MEIGGIKIRSLQILLYTCRQWVFPNPSTNFQVVSNDDMTVTVKPGEVWINGYLGFDDKDYILEIEPADGVLNRIDRIVARHDVVDRDIKIEVKKRYICKQPSCP